MWVRGDHRGSIVESILQPQHSRVKRGAVVRRGGANFDCALHNVNCISSQLTGPLMWHVIELKYSAKPKGDMALLKIIPGNIYPRH